MIDLEDFTRLNEQVEEGRRAKELLDNATFQHTLKYLKDTYSAQLFSTPDRELRDTYYHQHVALQMIEQLLCHQVAQGEQAEYDLKDVTN